MHYENLAELLEDRARRNADRPALVLEGATRREALTYRELGSAAARLAPALLAAGLQADDRVAILCRSRPLWGVAFFATARAGGVFLPLDPGSPATELARILDDAQPRLLFVAAEFEALASASLCLANAKPSVWRLDPGADRYGWPVLAELSATAVAPLAAVPRSAGDAALLTYTSGTMGSAKGVVTTVGNLLFQIEACERLFGNDETTVTVSILPLHHLFEITAGFLGVLNGGGSVRYCESLLPAEIVATSARARSTCMLTVPLFLQALERAIRYELRRQRWLRRLVSRAAMAAGPLLPVAARRHLLRRLHQRFGGRLRYFVCGGAPLAPGTLRFFTALGLPVYQGYGMAEASPIIATNAPGANRNGSVGRPLPGVELRITGGRCGEILTRGPHVMRGYFNDTGNAGAIVDADGWLHTGDLGALDPAGFLHVAGRKKNVIVLASGLKVQPELVETRLFDHPDIEEGCVVGMTVAGGLRDGSEEVCAVVVPCVALAQRYAGAHAALERHITALVREQATRLPPHQRPTRIIVSTTPLPRTTTRKIRRPLAGGCATGKAIPC